jgi:type IV secretion system protein VirB9
MSKPVSSSILSSSLPLSSLLVVVAAGVATAAFAQSARPSAATLLAAPTAPTRTARTVQYHARDVVAVRAKVRFTTLIGLPDGEDILEATCGDKEFWIVNAHGSIAYVKPAKPGSETNLNLLTASGRVYTFLLTEMSETKGIESDLAVYLEPDDSLGLAPTPLGPKYVLASQLDDFRAQAEIAREDLRKATETARTQLEDGLTTFRTAYPLSLQFPYRATLDRPPFFLRAIFHDDHMTYIQARATELPALYELKDGAANLVNFDVRNGIYVVPKVLDSGYLMLGKKHLVFTRAPHDEAR